MNFTATANSKTTIRWTRYGNASYNDGAAQGIYDEERKFLEKDRRVGIMVFAGAGAALKNKRITEITLTLEFSVAGYSDRTKTLYLRESNYQAIDETLNGSAYVGKLMGSLVASNGSGETATYTLNASQNAELFANLQKYLRAGNSAILAFDESTEYRGGANYTYNFLRVLTATMTVTYENGGVVYYDTGTEVVQCSVYYDTGTEIVQCVPYYDTGTEIKEIGG